MDNDLLPMLGACQTGVVQSKDELSPWLERIASFPRPCLWLLPELFFGGFDYVRKPAWCTATPDLLSWLLDFATSTGHALAGSVWTGTDGQARNALTVLLPGNPAPVMVYSKTHLFPTTGEMEHFRPGKHIPEPLAWQGLNLGMAICFDLRFPEFFRIQEPKGLDVFLICAQWPASRVGHWQALLRARAIENQVYVLGVNGSGETVSGPLAGRSTLIDPWGEIVFELGSGPDLIQSPIDPARVRRARASFDSTSSRFLAVVPRQDHDPSDRPGPEDADRG